MFKLLNNLFTDILSLNLLNHYNRIMKGIFIAIVTLCCAAQVKAQQAPQQNLMPDSFKPNNIPYKQLDSLSKLNTNTVPFNRLPNNFNNMPTAHMQGNSKMPVVQTDATGYNMPVAGMSRPKVYIMNRPNEEKPVAPAGNSDVK